MSITNHLSKKFYKALETGNLDECKSVYQMSIEMADFPPLDLHEDNEYPFKVACYNNRLNVAKWLHAKCIDEGYPIDIYSQSNYVFHTAYDSKFTELYAWLYALHQSE